MTNYLELQWALKSVWPELPAILGEETNAFETKLLELLRQLETAPAEKAPLDAVLTMLEDEYPNVFERMLDFMAKQPAAFRSTTTLATHASVGRYLIVPVWYATDREDTGQSNPDKRFSGNRGVLEFGRVEVSIPDKHKKGRLEKPRLFRLEFRQDPEKHVVLLSLVVIDAETWKSEVKAKLAGCSSRDILLFIHGYNVGFADAARRAAQFAHDLEFQGLVVLYSWPSEGKTILYTVDEDNAQWTVDQFEGVLKTVITELGAKRVHAVAHSMGNRVLTEGLRRCDTGALPPGSAKLREVVFAAPDINTDTFRKFVKKFYSRAERFTLYASNGDKALAASQKFHKYPRAGDAGDDLVLVPEIETIDASAVDQSWMGHSYFCENRAILQDLFSLIMEGKGAATPRYGLKACKQPQGSYWSLVL
jgi:esterase/lipase superfamily enzyme